MMCPPDRGDHPITCRAQRASGLRNKIILISDPQAPMGRPFGCLVLAALAQNPHDTQLGPAPRCPFAVSFFGWRVLLLK